MNRWLVILIAIILTSKVYAQTNTCTAAGGGTWATAVWSLGRIPNSGDNVVINSGVNLTINTAAVCGALTLGNSTAANTSLTITSTGSLVISGTTGNLRINPSNVNRTFNVNVNSGTLTVTGNVVYPTTGNSFINVTTGTATFNNLITLSTRDYLVFNTPGTGTIYLNGGLTDGAGSFTTLSGSKTYIKSSYTITQNTTWASGSNVYMDDNVTISTGGRTLSFANLSVLNGTTTLGGGGITVTGNFSLAANTTFNCQGNTIAGNATGSFTMGANSNLILGSTTVASGVTFPTNFIAANISINSTATVYYRANATQTISSAPTYGNLVLSTGATSTNKTLAGNTTVLGNLTVSNGTGTTTLVGGANTLNLTGNFSGNGNTSFTTGNFNISGSWLNTGSLSPGNGTVNYNGTGTQTIGAANYYNLTSSSTGARILASSGTIGVAGTFTPGTNTYTITGSTISYNGNTAQNIANFTYNNLTLTTGATATNKSITASPLVVQGNLTTTNGTAAVTLLANANTINLSGDYLGNGNLTFTTGTLNIGGSWTNTGTFTRGTSTVNYYSASTQTIGAVNYYNLTSSGTGARTLSGTGTIGIENVFTTGTNVYTTTGSTVNFFGSGAQTIPALNYNNLTISGARTVNNVTLTNSGTIGIAGTFTFSATFTTGVLVSFGSTISYNGNVAQTIINLPVPYYNLTLTTGSASVSKTPPATLNVSGDLTLTNGTGTVTLPANAGTINLTGNFAGNGNLTFTTGTFNIGGNWTNTGTFTPGTGTVNYNGTGTQTIGAANYYNLTSSSTGARILASSGTIGVAGTFTPGTNTYTITGSTISYNGNTAQNIANFTYNNLTLTTGATATNKSITASPLVVQGNLTTTNGTAAVTLLANANTINLSGDYLGNGNLTFTTGTLNIEGNWTNTGVFTAGTGTVNFNGTGTQSIPALSYYNLTSSSTGARVLASSGTINIGGAFSPGTNSYTITGSTINYNATGAQNVAGFTYNNLTLSVSGLKTAVGDINLIGTCTLSGSVTFDADGASNDLIFTLKSDASGTARIAAIPGTATFSGNIVGERYAPGGATGWAILGPYTSGGTLAKWLDDFPMSGFPGSTGNAAGFISVYTYDETINDLADNRYVEATDISNPITPGKGVYVYLGTGPGTTPDITIETDGPIVQGNFNFNPSFTSTSYGIAEDGWNLVANPYPSTIDWDAAGWTKTNISGTIYFYNADIGNYATYTTGVGGTSGGTRYIASGQGFFIKATNSTRALTCTESVKSAVNPTFFKQSDQSVTALQPQSFSFQLKGQGTYQDETIILLSEFGSLAFNAEEDALKLNSTEPGAVNISTQADGFDLTLNNIGNLLGSPIDLPLKVTTTQSQNVELRLLSTPNFPAGLCINLLDLHTGNSYTITPGFSLNFILHDTTRVARFILTLNRSVNAQVFSADCQSNFSGLVLSSAQPSLVNIENLVNNQSITVTVNPGVTDSIELAPGNYLYSSTGGCGTQTDTISILDEKVNVIADFILLFDTLDISQSSEFVPINLSQNSQDFSWYLGNQSYSGIAPSITVTENGNHNLTLVASEGLCRDTFTVGFVAINGNPLNLADNKGSDLIYVYKKSDGDFILVNRTGFAFSSKIYDSKGALVHSQTFGKGIWQDLNLSSLRPGIYFMHVYGANSFEQKIKLVR